MTDSQHITDVLVCFFDGASIIVLSGPPPVVGFDAGPGVDLEGIDPAPDSPGLWAWVDGGSHWWTDADGDSGEDWRGRWRRLTTAELAAVNLIESGAVTEDLIEDAMSDLLTCKRFRWMPGMVTESGARCIAGPRDDADGVRRWLWAIPGLGSKWVGNIVDPPDLTDPATLGCMLALVREAWGCVVDVEEYCTRDGLHQFEVRIWPSDSEPSSATAATLGEALVQSLIDAPERAP